MAGVHQLSELIFQPAVQH